MKKPKNEHLGVLELVTADGCDAIYRDGRLAAWDDNIYVGDVAQAAGNGRWKIVHRIVQRPEGGNWPMSVDDLEDEK